MNPSALTEVFSALAGISWRASWLIAVLLVLRWLVRGRIPARIWFFVWLVLAARLLVPASVPAAWSPYNFTAWRPTLATENPSPEIRVAAARGSGELRVRADQVASGEAGLTRAAPAQSTPVPGHLRPAVRATPAMTWREGAALGWLGGLVLLAGLRVHGVWNFRRRLRTARAAGDPRLRGLIEREGVVFGAAGLTCLETDAVDAPALYGIWRPRLLLPPGFTQQLTDDELRLVVRHEIAHGRRRDLTALGLLHGAAVVHWFNPLAWVAVRTARTDCELACDESVLRHESAAGAASYGGTLLKVLGVTRGGRRPAPVVAIIEGRQQLAQRIRRIANYRAATAASVLAGILLVGGLGVASVTREAVAQETTARPSAPGVSREEAAVVVRAPNASLTGGNEQHTLVEMINAQRKVVDQLARELEAYKQKHQLGAFDQQKDMAAAALRSAHAHHLEAKQVLGVVENRLNQFNDYRGRNADLSMLPFIASEHLVGELKEQMARLRIELAIGAERYLERHPRMIEMNSRLDRLHSALDEAVSAAGRQLEATRDAAQRAVDAAQAEVEQAAQKALALDRMGLEYELRVRELRTQTALLQEVFARASGALRPGQEQNAAPPPGLNISVLGAVHHQGVVTFPANENPIPLDAIARAGGFTGAAQRSAVRVIRQALSPARTTFELTEAELLGGQGPAGALQAGDIVFVPDKSL